MINSVVQRGLMAFRRRAESIIRRARLRQVRQHREIRWQQESARAFSHAGSALKLVTDDSAWGYQISSEPLRVPGRQWAVLRLRGRLVCGAVSVGFLDASRAKWLTTQVLTHAQIDEVLLLDPSGESEIVLVLSNADSGSATLELDDVSLQWMPAALAAEYGNSQESIMAEIKSLIDSAREIPLAADLAEPSPVAPWSGNGAYLRTDYWVKIKAGGSYGHTCYVAQGLANRTHRLVCFMANRYELLDAMGIEQEIMDVPSKTSNEIDVLQASRFYFSRLRERLAVMRPQYLYERAILGSYVGAKLSQELEVPYILEYNGSEISMKRSFDDRGYELEEAFALAERAAFAQATAIVAVSQIVAESLMKQGVPADKILVNPNGCSPDVYRPLDEQERRQQRLALGWNDAHCVVGFIGTFGGWHGIDVLAESLPRICASDDRIRLLLIGDGNFRHLVDEAVKLHGLADRVHMPGLVPQIPAGKMLACSDILVSPHSRHMIDSRFFGSPTKVFEYMALGGAIVASRLEQIGEVLSPALTASELLTVTADQASDKRAVLCTPGDADEFAKAVVGLASRRDLWPVLGRNARQVLIDEYTWERHVERILRFAIARSKSLRGAP